MTCTTRGSLARARVSTLPSKATLVALSSVEMGSVGPYSARLRAILEVPTLLLALERASPMERTVRAASSKEASEMSSEYANAVFSPLTARTPTPWSMLKLPVLTMPSSKLQPSERVYWKYRSASSTRWALISASARQRWDSSKPKGVRSRDLAVARRSRVGSRAIIGPL